MGGYMKEFPMWFWGSILIYTIISWLAVACTIFLSELLLTNFNWPIGYFVFYSGIFLYPVFFVIMIVCLFKKVKLNSDLRIWAFLILLIPLLANLPLLASLQNVDELLK